MKNKLLCRILVIATVVLMVGAAEITGIKEIIFPEITAIAIGLLLPEKRAWNTSLTRIFLTVSAMAFCGIAIVRFADYVSVGRMVAMPLAFLVALVSLIISKTTFLPQISACVLPVFLHTDTIIYPCSVMVLTGIILLEEYILERKKIRTKWEFVSEKYDAGHYVDCVVQLIVVSVFFEIAVFTKQLYFVVPPLIVGYMEAASPSSSIRKRPFSAVLLMFFAALSGTLSKYFLNVKLGLPLVFAAFSAIVILLGVMWAMKMYLPPSAAICTLPMLIEIENVWKYPLETALGFAVMVAVSFISYRREKSVSKKG